MCIIVVHYLPLQNISSATNYSIFIVLLWNDVVSLSVFNWLIMVLHRHTVCVSPSVCVLMYRLHMFLQVQYIWSHPVNEHSLPFYLHLYQISCLFTFAPFNKLKYRWSMRCKFKEDTKQSSGPLMSPEKKSSDERRNESRPLPVAGLESFYFGLVTSEV